jgi:probable O-glycosylation ligase (exosortase A-associated)
VAIVGSYSRGAFLAGFAMAFFLWWKSPKKAVLGILMVVIIPLVITFMPDKYMAKMGTIETYDEDASAMGRINAWWFAFNLAKDHPITGGGFGAFDKQLFQIYAPEPDNFHDAHSIYFEVLGEQGFVGLTIFLIIGFLAWRTGSKIINKTRNRSELKWAEQLASMVQVSIIGFAVGGSFLGLAYFDLYYHLIAILVITSYIVDKTLNDKEQHDSLETNHSISYEPR